MSGEFDGWRLKSGYARRWHFPRLARASRGLRRWNIDAGTGVAAHRIMSTRKSDSSGKAATTASPTRLVSRKGRAPRAIRSSGRFVMFAATKRLMPIGGVISPIARWIITTTPNHTRPEEHTYELQPLM